MLDCPVCPRTQIAGEVCPQCGTDLKPLLRLAELRSESQRPRATESKPPFLAIAAFAVGLAILPAWRALRPERVPPPPAPVVEVPPEKPLATQAAIYTVQKGDSLWSIAERKYGMGQMWKMIRDDNESLRKSRALRPGDKIRLPTVSIAPKVGD